MRSERSVVRPLDPDLLYERGEGQAVSEARLPPGFRSIRGAQLPPNVSTADVFLCQEQGSSEDRHRQPWRRASETSDTRASDETPSLRSVIDSYFRDMDLARCDGRASALTSAVPPKTEAEALAQFSRHQREQAAERSRRQAQETEKAREAQLRQDRMAMRNKQKWAGKNMYGVSDFATRDEALTSSERSDDHRRMVLEASRDATVCTNPQCLQRAVMLCVRTSSYVCFACASHHGQEAVSLAGKGNVNRDEDTTIRADVVSDQGTSFLDRDAPAQYVGERQQQINRDRANTSSYHGVANDVKYAQRDMEKKLARQIEHDERGVSGGDAIYRHNRTAARAIGAYKNELGDAAHDYVLHSINDTWPLLMAHAKACTCAGVCEYSTLLHPNTGYLLVACVVAYDAFSELRRVTSPSQRANMDENDTLMIAYRQMRVDPKRLVTIQDLVVRTMVGAKSYIVQLNMTRDALNGMRRVTKLETPSSSRQSSVAAIAASTKATSKGSPACNSHTESLGSAESSASARSNDGRACPATCTGPSDTSVAMQIAPGVTTDDIFEHMSRVPTHDARDLSQRDGSSLTLSDASLGFFDAYATERSKQIAHIQGSDRLLHRSTSLDQLSSSDGSAVSPSLGARKRSFNGAPRPPSRSSTDSGFQVFDSISEIPASSVEAMARCSVSCANEASGTPNAATSVGRPGSLLVPESEDERAIVATLMQRLRSDMATIAIDREVSTKAKEVMKNTAVATSLCCAIVRTASLHQLYQEGTTRVLALCVMLVVDRDAATLELDTHCKPTPAPAQRASTSHTPFCSDVDGTVIVESSTPAHKRYKPHTDRVFMSASRSLGRSYVEIDNLALELVQAIRS